ncbi:hypothetical protein ABC733_22200 [Mangrovibacter sp. SLW1]
MMVVAAKLIASPDKEDAEKCWAEIGRAILGRGNDVSQSSISYSEGMTADDILALASTRTNPLRQTD